MSGRVPGHYIWVVIRVLLLFSCKFAKIKITGKPYRELAELALGLGATARGAGTLKGVDGYMN